MEKSLQYERRLWAGYLFTRYYLAVAFMAVAILLPQVVMAADGTPLVDMSAVDLSSGLAMIGSMAALVLGVLGSLFGIKWCIKLIRGQG